MAHTAAHASPVRLSRRALLNLGIFLIFLYVLLPQVGRFHDSWALLGHVQGGWVILALGFTVMTYVLAGSIYWLLAKRHVRFSRTVVVQCASMFANRLVPAGIGAIGVNYEYLRRNKHTKPQAAAVVAANNTMGFFGHMLLLATVFVFVRPKLTAIRLPHIVNSTWWLIAAVVVLAVGLLWARQLSRSLLRTIRQVGRNLAGYRTHPLKALLALGCSILLTTCYALCLFASAHALGIALTASQALLVLTIGVAGGTATPTPGGLGGAEAGLVAGLLVFGVHSADALAVALLYRLFTYWLALAGGSGAFWFAERVRFI